VIKDKVDMLSTSSSADTKAARAAAHSHQQARILRIQRDPKTYPHPSILFFLIRDKGRYNESPTDAGYEAWSANINAGVPENTEAIAHLLTSNESVREFHTALVPAKVISYEEREKIHITL
jgi:hypothetical protein